MQSYLSRTSSRFTRRHGRGVVFNWRVLDNRPGLVIAELSGDNAASLMQHESGGHRWQRIPPTERSGRRQSSTVTVAVFSGSAKQPTFDERDVEFKFCVASVGAGGQNRQKNETACVAIHRPTGLRAQCQDERSQSRNKQKALNVLRQRVLGGANAKEHAKQNANRQEQIGSGERGDKIRTVQVCHGIVTCHRTGRKMPLVEYLKGRITF